MYTGSITNNPRNTVEENWSSMPNGFYICALSQGALTWAFVGKVSNLYGSIFMMGYSLSWPMYGFIESGTWRWYSINKTQVQT